jgi:hypothetical protein
MFVEIGMSAELFLALTDYAAIWLGVYVVYDVSLEPTETLGLFIKVFAIRPEAFEILTLFLAIYVHGFDVAHKRVVLVDGFSYEVTTFPFTF